MRAVFMLWCSLSLIGCATPPKPIQMPLDSKQWLYGMGEGATLTQAEQAALQAIAGKLNTQISSQLERLTQETLDHSTDHVTRRINSRVSDVNLSNFQRFETRELESDVQVLLGVDRLAIARRWREELRQYEQRFDELAGDTNGSSIFRRWQQSLMLEPDAIKADARALLLLSVDSQQAPDANFQYQLQKLQSSLVSRLTPDLQGDSSSLIQQLKVVLSEQDINGSCRQTCELQLKFHHSLILKEFNGQLAAKLTFYGTLSDSRGSIGVSEWSVIGTSMSSKEQAKNAALELAVEKIRQEGIWNAFGFNNNKEYL